MIKIIYKQKPYRYNDVGYQDYKIDAEIELNEDISSRDAIIAFLKLLNIATYRVSIETLKDVIQDLQDEGYVDSERIL